MKAIYLCFTIILFLSFNSFAQETSPFGIWKTIDDETNEAKAYVEIYKDGEQMKGKIIKLLVDPEDSICDKCPDDKKDKPIIGMEIIWDMVSNGDQWSDGKILKPENGKTYTGKIWVEDGKLQVRGYIGFMYKTQTWLRVE
ncbi:DUF2147 domain-containing protein [Flammeovirga kamogawensis]|uniref:DUF2147 domain-containing protein n=1 Tax=Flammeovirga kamogawensis TaxID=373891 RepID=A0ABX8GX68_9BACT|nr:DUF2147 domain-containing protein [Flammeovirga kamogawensis]MBB6460659.1 uncharacterized protein (DUF2147 family) [Flammeovirga kamogawensis]QWG08014.1 DUF2147 domain-containing protein [Flammeovirga kamogawensis]TRX69821.1 DUF2147 domain-containing protein [Flammeovirga kamogawensis]